MSDPEPDPLEAAIRAARAEGEKAGAEAERARIEAELPEAKEYLSYMRAVRGETPEVVGVDAEGNFVQLREAKTMEDLAGAFKALFFCEHSEEQVLEGFRRAFELGATAERRKVVAFLEEKAAMYQQMHWSELSGADGAELWADAIESGAHDQGGKE